LPLYPNFLLLSHGDVEALFLHDSNCALFILWLD
jgi:hypothetical protein